MHRKILSLFFVVLLIATGHAMADEGNNGNVPSEAGHTVGSTSKKVVNATKEAAGEVKEGSKKAGKSVWGAMKDFGKGVKEGWKDVTNGPNETPPPQDEDVKSEER